MFLKKWSLITNLTRVRYPMGNIVNRSKIPVTPWSVGLCHWAESEECDRDRRIHFTQCWCWCRHTLNTIGLVCLNFNPFYPFFGGTSVRLSDPQGAHPCCRFAAVYSILACDATKRNLLILYVWLMLKAVLRRKVWRDMNNEHTALTKSAPVHW